jgi:ABC-type multidrug transport system permease subunit
MERDLRKAASVADAETRTRLRAELAPLRDFLNQTAVRRQELVTWLEAVQQRAILSSQIPPPPAPPALPRELAALAGGDVDAWLRRVIPPTGSSIKLPTLSNVDLPEPPAVPDVTLPRVPKIPRFKLPGTLEINEMSVTGAPTRLNTFDQNVPGFSVTFLLLGMLLGISLGLLDERDWGTLEKLRATSTPFSIVLVAKLVARFLVGVVQMLILFAVGWAAFGISLGPQPWALLLPTTGIVFAGTAFGLIVAGVASSREAVLPLGSMVIITMAAVGGCWWPIELEPGWMRRLALVFPTTWAMSAYNDLMIRQQSFEAALRPTAVLYSFGSLYLALGLALLRRRSFS